MSWQILWLMKLTKFIVNFTVYNKYLVLCPKLCRSLRQFKLFRQPFIMHGIHCSCLLLPTGKMLQNFILFIRINFRFLPLPSQNLLMPFF